MHESSLTSNLLRQVEYLAEENDATRIVRVELTIGALAPISPSHLREHFAIAAEATPAEGAIVEIHVSDDPYAPNAQGVTLENVELA